MVQFLLLCAAVTEIGLGAGLPTRAQKVMKRAMVLVRKPSRILNAAYHTHTRLSHSGCCAEMRLQRLLVNCPAFNKMWIYYSSPHNFSHCEMLIKNFVRIYIFLYLPGSLWNRKIHLSNTRQREFHSKRREARGFPTHFIHFISLFREMINKSLSSRPAPCVSSGHFSPPLMMPSG